MALYRVLLVDDEEEIRSGIGRKIEWTGLGFELVGEAGNGDEALELSESLRPDLVMTDIRMPFMDGLELCRRLSVRLPGVKLVVFSGYDDFSYAKQAIRANVSEYILKPINAAELTAVLQKLRAELDREFEERRDLERLRRRHDESLPLLREQFYLRLLDGRAPAERIGEQAALYDIDLSGSLWVAALVHLSPDASESLGQRELLTLSARMLIDENLAGLEGSFKTTLYNDSVAVIGGFAGHAAAMGFIDDMNRVCKLARRFLSLTMTVGIGLPCDSLSDLRRSAEGARTALDYRVLLGGGRAIFIGDVEGDLSAGPELSEQDERELQGAVKLGSPEEIGLLTDRLMARMRDALPAALSHHQIYFLELQAALVKLIRAYRLDMAEVFGQDFAGAAQLTRFSSLAELGSWYYNSCLRINEQIGRLRTDSAKLLVERARDHIDRHYADEDLSVEALCGHLHLSPAYFSTVFKRETGMGFTSYVTDARMRRAAELLRTTQDKTHVVARQVGYGDANYFSYVFKRRYGLSPTKYRTRQPPQTD